MKRFFKLTDISNNVTFIDCDSVAIIDFNKHSQIVKVKFHKQGKQSTIESEEYRYIISIDII